MGFDPGVLDTDLKKVFSIGQKFILNMGNGEYKEIFMRVPSEEILNNARVYSLRESYKYRTIIENDDVLKKAIMPREVDFDNKEDLINYILLTKKDVYISRARSEVGKRIKFPKMPSSFDDNKKWEEYQKEVDEWPEKYAKELEEEVNKFIEADRKFLNSMSIEKLRKKVENAAIDIFVYAYGIQRYIDYIISKIVYYEDNLMFSSPDEVKDLPTHIRGQLVQFYNEISLDTGYLKKLPGVWH